MRRFPVVNRNVSRAGILLTGILLSVWGLPAVAQVPPPSYVGAGAAAASSSAAAAASQEIVKQSAEAYAADQQKVKEQNQNIFLQGLYAAAAAQQGGAAGLGAFTGAEDKAAAEERQRQADLGSATDPNSARYKSERLAKKAIEQRNEQTLVAPKKTPMAEVGPPPEVETLQRVNESLGGDAGAAISDDPIDKALSLDLRKEAQKEAALSYGARGGLAKHSYEIMERMKGFDQALDKIFNFRALLIKAPSGLMIEPPIIKESDDALVITDGGNEAAVANEVFDINKHAKIVSAPRDWRQYLVQTWSDVPPPPRILWPKNAQEQADWNKWVAQGWKAGYEQAEQIFETNTNRLLADFRGMVRYRMLLSQGMISEPYAMHEVRGVTGNKNQMRVGDSALRITGPSQFLMGADLWKPADR